ncbi:MAG: helix-turn-helix domain-containing protein [Clostridia bacterium]|nr:helix-turn-helix domain-containing protein [Clostridia bacterium]
MIGDMIAKIRKEKGMTKTELARRTGINIGHLTHIEKGERNPSQNALKNICKALNTPYQPLMYTYGKTLSEEQEAYGFINYIAYDKVLAIDNISSLIPCPSNVPSSAIAIKMPDDSMLPDIEKDKYVFVEFNTLLENKDIGLFALNDQFLIRRFYSKNGQITLKSGNKETESIKINPTDKFYIIGKVLISE